MSAVTGSTAQPFRWDLVTPDQLGTLLRDTAEPDLWFAPRLAQCAAKVLARSGGGDLYFVGRSLDSMFDLLGGALTGITVPQVFRLPLSFSGATVRRGEPFRRPLSPPELAHARAVLTDAGLAPSALARRPRPATFVDVVDSGSTFTEVYTLLRDWVDDDRLPWNVIRRRLCFVGVTIRTHTSPNTFRWKHSAPWTRQLPANSVLSVSLDLPVWSYLGNSQVKLTRSHYPDRWLSDLEGPGRDARTRQALAEAVALVAFGRSPLCRALLAETIGREPNLRRPWLRAIHRQLSRGV